MPTYPSLPQAEGTKLVPRSGIMVRTATNGASRARALSSAQRYDAQLFHRLLSLADLQSIQTFHEANRGAAFDVYYTPEARTISCFFAAEKPYDAQPVQASAGVILFDVTVNLVQAS